MSQSSNPATLEEVLNRIRRKFEVEFEPLAVDDTVYEVLSVTNMQSYLDALIKTGGLRNPIRDLPLWAKVWPSSFILGRFLRKYEPQGKSLLELGAGAGICGLIASAYGFADITLTDSEDMALDFARANILRNQLEDRVTVKRLDLADPTENSLKPAYEMIAASEILYLDHLHKPLLSLVRRKLAPNGRAFFCTDMGRLKPHFKKLAQADFKVQEGHIGVKSDDEDGVEQRRIYSILILEKRND